MLHAKVIHFYGWVPAYLPVDADLPVDVILPVDAVFYRWMFTCTVIFYRWMIKMLRDYRCMRMLCNIHC